MATSRKRNVLFGAILSVVMLVVFEGALRLMTAAYPPLDEKIAVRVRVSATIPDPRLNIRPNPAYQEHDENGFRNAAVPDSVDVVCMGDSQTYGTSVEPMEAWPQVLNAFDGVTAYSMAAGSYSPTHGLILMDEALAMQPETVVYALYSGNDFLDTFRHVHGAGQLPELASTDQDTIAALRAAEAVESATDRANRYFALLKPPGDKKPSTDASTTPPFWHHSKLGLLCRAVVLRIRSRLKRWRRADGEGAWAKMEAIAANPETHCDIYDKDGMRTLITATYRGAVVDVTDVRVREGYRIAMASLLKMKARADSAGVGFAVVFIPTKEYVFLPMTETPSVDHVRLGRQESVLWSSCKEDLAAAGIETVDTTPALRASLARGENPYPESWDGHPSAVGHRAIAGAVSDALSKSRGTR